MYQMSAHMVHLSITETQLEKLQPGSAILQGQPKKSDVLTLPPQTLQIQYEY